MGKGSGEAKPVGSGGNGDDGVPEGVAGVFDFVGFAEGVVRSVQGTDCEIVAIVFLRGVWRQVFDKPGSEFLQPFQAREVASGVPGFNVAEAGFQEFLSELFGGLDHLRGRCQRSTSSLQEAFDRIIPENMPTVKVTQSARKM